MLRYVFDTAVQLRSHLHAATQGACLFFPDLALDHKGGDPVPLEIELRQPKQQVVLRGIIHSRVGGGNPGIWVQFSDLRLARKLETEAETISQRRHPRIPSDMMIEVREQDASGRIARLLDVSVGGACLGAAGGLRTGTEVDLHLLARVALKPIPRVSGVVVRALGGEVGIRFPREMEEPAAKLVDANRQAWKAARTVTHALGCCGPLGTLDPPVPRLRSDARVR